MSPTTHYRDLGLVTRKELFQKALEGKYPETLPVRWVDGKRFIINCKERGLK